MGEVSRLEAIQTMIKDRFGQFLSEPEQQIKRTLNAQEAIARGATIYAAKLASGQRPLQFMEAQGSLDDRGIRKLQQDEKSQQEIDEKITQKERLRYEFNCILNEMLSDKFKLKMKEATVNMFGEKQRELN